MMKSAGVKNKKKSFAARLVLTRCGKLLFWKRALLCTLMILACFFAIVFAWNGGGRPHPLAAAGTLKLKNFIFFPASGEKYIYGDLNDQLLEKVKDSPYDSFAIQLTDVNSADLPTYSSLSTNLAAAKRSGKLIWPRIYINRIVGCCEEANCVSCGSVPAYFKNITDNGKGIDLWDRTGALSDFYALLETSLKLAKDNGSPGIFVDHEFYHNGAMYGITAISRLNNITQEEIIAQLRTIGRNAADKVNEVYPNAVILFASADFSIIRSDGNGRTPSYIIEGMLQRAKERNYSFKVVEGGENSLWYAHSGLDAPGLYDLSGSPAGLKQKMAEQESKLKFYLDTYPNNFMLGGTQGLYLDWRNTKGKWLEFLTYFDNLGRLEARGISDLPGLFEYLFENREYVWVFGGSLNPYGYNEFAAGDYSYNGSDYISQFRNSLKSLFCGNGTCESNRGESCSSCPGDCGACPDIIPPAVISSLSVFDATANSANIFWIAPGDDNADGAAASYDARYSTSPITESSWSGASQATGEPAPQIAGINQSFAINNLASNSTYYFAIKTVDNAGNISGLSNVVSIKTQPGASTPSLDPPSSPDLTPAPIPTPTSTPSPAVIPNGSLVKLQNAPDIYLIENNQRKAIPDIETFRAKGYSISNIQIISESSLAQYAQGAGVSASISDIHKTAPLYKSDARNEVYALVYGKMHWIPNMSVFNQYQYGADKISVVPQKEIDKYPKARLIKASDSDKVYYLTGRYQKRWIRTPQIFNSYGFNWDDIMEVDTQEINVYNDNLFVRAGGDSKVYILENNIRRHIKSIEAFTSRNYRWEDIDIISKIELNSCPELAGVE